jgi:hypothetical protein
VEVADVEDLEGPVPGREYGDLGTAYDEVADLDPGGVRQRPETRDSTQPDSPSECAQAARNWLLVHANRLPQWVT